MNWSPATTAAPLVLAAFLSACASRPPQPPQVLATMDRVVPLQPMTEAERKQKLDREQFEYMIAFILTANRSPEDTSAVANVLLAKYALADEITEGMMLDITASYGISRQDLKDQSNIFRHMRQLVNDAAGKAGPLRERAWSELGQILAGERYKTYPGIDFAAREFLRDELTRVKIDPDTVLAARVRAYKAPDGKLSLEIPLGAPQ